MEIKTQLLCQTTMSGNARLWLRPTDHRVFSTEQTRSKPEEFGQKQHAPHCVTSSSLWCINCVPQGQAIHALLQYPEVLKGELWMEKPKCGAWQLVLFKTNVSNADKIQCTLQRARCEYSEGEFLGGIYQKCWKCCSTLHRDNSDLSSYSQSFETLSPSSPSVVLVPTCCHYCFPYFHNDSSGL